MFDALRANPSRITILKGSARSTKTYSLIQYWISLALDNDTKPKPEKLRFLALRQRLTWMRHTVVADFKTIMQTQFGLWDEDNFNKKESTYKLGNSEFIFSGLDDSGGQKFHGLALDYLWCNEANEVDWSSIDQLLIRMKKGAFFDYNPNINANHWLLKKLEERPDCTVVHSTYLDNPFLEQSIIDEIESREPTPANIENGTADAIIWKIYGLGLRGEIKGLVYPNIKIIKEMPTNDNFGYGMDWGFSSDPTTLVKCFEMNGELYLHEELYEAGLLDITNPHNPSAMSVEYRLAEKKIPKDKRIWADSSDPKAIKNIQYAGWDIDRVSKPPGSILGGINLVKRYPINVTEESMNLIDELQKYTWKENKNRESTTIPVDTYNHLCDGFRYWAWMELGDYSHRRTGSGGCGIMSVKMNTGADRYGY